MKSQKLSILDLIHAAQEFKYLLDILPPGTACHPGRGDEDIRDSDAYRRAAEALNHFNKGSKLSDVYYTDAYLREGCRVVIEVPRCPDERWGFSIYAPECLQPLEGYSFEDFEKVLASVRFWAAGQKVPPEHRIKQ